MLCSFVRTGREIITAWLKDEMRQATVADLHRAAQFLEFAREVRGGSKRNRRNARTAQRGSWRKYVDPPARW